MSADNYLISLPAKGNKIALYLVAKSDARIDLDGPFYLYSKSIAQHYASSKQGVYDTEEELNAAVEALHSDSYLQIEYPPVFRHQKGRADLKVTEGCVVISGKNGYSWVGNEEAVCFHFDIMDRAYVMSSGINEESLPEIVLDVPVDDLGDVFQDRSPTVVEFVGFKGWHVHAATGGKSVSVALVKSA